MPEHRSLQGEVARRINADGMRDMPRPKRADLGKLALELAGLAVLGLVVWVLFFAFR